MPPPPKENKGFFKLKKKFNCLPSYSNIMDVCSKKKCVFQYGRRPGESIGILGCNAPPPLQKKTKQLFLFFKNLHP